MIKKLNRKIYIIFMKSVFQSNTFSFRDLIILDSEIIIHVFNNLSQFSNFQKTLHEDFLIIRNLKVLILNYEDVTLQTTKKVLQFKNMIFCTNFAINFVSFSLLKEKNIYWNTINNILFCKNDCLIIETLKETARQQMLQEIELSSVLATNWIHQKISWAFCLSFTKNSTFWHACMKHSESMSFHKLDLICLDMTFQDLLITKCKICNLIKIKYQISQ